MFHLRKSKESCCDGAHCSPDAEALWTVPSLLWARLEVFLILIRQGAQIVQIRGSR